MAASYTMLSSLSPQSDSFKILVRATRIWEAINKHNNMLLHTNIILLDQEDNHILATVRNNQKHIFMPMLAEDAVYSITNFKVVPGPQIYRSVDRDLSINFFYKTKIQQKSDVDIIPRYKFELQTFQNVKTLVGKIKGFIDVTGMVTSYGQLAKTSAGAHKMDVILSNISGEKIVVTLWEARALKFQELLSKNMGTAIFVVIIGLIVKNFSDTASLSSSDATKSYLNIDYAPLNDLKHALSTANGNSLETLPPPVAKQFISADENNVKELSIKVSWKWSFQQEKMQVVRCLCKAKVIDVLNDNGWYYNCCPKCVRTVRLLEGKYYCGNCAEAANPFIQRYRLVVRVEDASGTTTFTLFNKEAEQLIGVPLSKIMAELKENESVTNMPLPVKNLVGKSCVFQVKVTSYNTTRGCEEYTVTRLSEVSPQDNNPQTDSTDKAKKKQKIA